MGKRKRSKIVKPWCWYCEREFEDEAILYNHQQARHFRCPRSDCRQFFFGFRQLSQHAETSHSMKLESIPNALPHRNDPTLDIAGMDGIPESDYYEHEKKILGDRGSTQPKGPSYDELSEEQLRAQVAQYQAAVHSGSYMGSQQHYDSNYNHGNYSHSHFHNTDQWSSYSHLPSNAGTTASRRPSKASLSPKSYIDPTSIPPLPSEPFADPPPAPPPPELSPPPSVTATPRQTSISPSIHSLPTPSSIHATTNAQYYHRNQQQHYHGLSGTTPNLGPVSPSTRDRLTSRKTTRIILVYPHEVSSDELRANSMSKS